jgi:hypothetical protein
MCTWCHRCRSRARYLALAEALDAPLYTCDRKLNTDGHNAEALVLPRTR